MRPQDYEIAIRPLTQAEGGGFGATVPELPGCMSDGETPQEALGNAYDAIGCWVEEADGSCLKVEPVREIEGPAS